jgi:hypothetical protein
MSPSALPQVPVAQRLRVASDAVISAYINELAGSAHVELPREQPADRVREALARAS